MLTSQPYFKTHPCNQRTQCAEQVKIVEVKVKSKKDRLGQNTSSFKLRNSSTDFNNQSVTQTQRFLNAVRYSRVLKTSTGNNGNLYSAPKIMFLGKVEGQSGGLTKALKNR